MTIHTQVSMTDDEIDEFLSERQTAVLALAYANQPYAIPITYRFDPDRRRFYFRLIYPTGSEKHKFRPGLGEARLVVYDEVEPLYRSVMAIGQPRELRDADITAEQIVQFGKTSRPLFEMWAQPKSDLDIRLYELDPDTLTGRRIDVEDTGE